MFFSVIFSLKARLVSFKYLKLSSDSKIFLSFYFKRVAKVCVSKLSAGQVLMGIFPLSGCLKLKKCVRLQICKFVVLFTRLLGKSGLTSEASREGQANIRRGCGKTIFVRCQVLVLLVHRSQSRLLLLLWFCLYKLGSSSGQWTLQEWERECWWQSAALEREDGWDTLARTERESGYQDYKILF